MPSRTSEDSCRVPVSVLLFAACGIIEKKEKPQFSKTIVLHFRFARLVSGQLGANLSLLQPTNPSYG